MDRQCSAGGHELDTRRNCRVHRRRQWCVLQAASCDHSSLAVSSASCRDSPSSGATNTDVSVPTSPPSCLIDTSAIRQQLCIYNFTRSSADADKPARRVWRSFKVTKHSTIPYARYSFLLCNSNFVFLRYSTSKNAVTLKWGQMSLKVIESGIIR